MFGLKICVRVQTFWRGPPVPPHNFCHPGTLSTWQKENKRNCYLSFAMVQGMSFSYFGEWKSGWHQCYLKRSSRSRLSKRDFRSPFPSPTHSWVPSTVLSSLENKMLCIYCFRLHAKWTIEHMLQFPWSTFSCKQVCANYLITLCGNTACKTSRTLSLDSNW